MGGRRISITEEAYERLKSLSRNEKVSFSDVILGHFPKRRKLSEVLNKIGDCSELADSIEKASREMRKTRFREFRT
jgi:predicted CopG family antitoxin